MTKIALITGITGQDGSYLAELLLEKGYEIHGLVRHLSSPNISRIEHILDKITLVEGDLADQSSLDAAILEINPDEVYNLAAQSFVGTSWNQPILTGDVTGMGAVRLLESLRHFCKDARIYQASSSEMFGKPKELHLGDLNAKRDWGYAGDYVEAMWLMLQQDKPDDYVVATGEAHSVREFVELAFAEVGLDWEKYVKVDKKFFRPADVEYLIGDSSKAKKVFGWEPKVTFEELVKMMVKADIERMKK